VKEKGSTLKGERRKRPGRKTSLGQEQPSFGEKGGRWKSRGGWIHKISAKSGGPNARRKKRKWLLLDKKTTKPKTGCFNRSDWVRGSARK